MEETKVENGITQCQLAKERIIRLISDLSLQEGDELPSERDLVKRLNLSRCALRQGFEILEPEGALWRSVERGTFLGQRPLVSTTDVLARGTLTSSLEIIQSRQILEPSLSALVALGATSEGLEGMRVAVEKSCAGSDPLRVDS